MFEEKRKRVRLRTLFVVITVATIPCYCAGLGFVRLSRWGRDTPTPTRSTPVSPTLTETAVESLRSPFPTFTPTFTPWPTSTLTPSPTWTRTVVPSPTSSYTPTDPVSFTPTITLTPTPAPTDTEIPALTPSPSGTATGASG